MRAYVLATFALAELAAGSNALAAQAASQPSAQPSPDQEAVRKAKSARALAALKAASVPEELKAAIAADIIKFDGKTATERIADRLRLDLVGRGVFGLGLKAQIANELRASATPAPSASSARSAPPLRDDEVLRKLAAKQNLEVDPAKLRSMLTTEQSIATATTLFGDSFAHALQQISPLTPVGQKPPKAPPAKPGSTAVATANRTPVFGVRIGPVAAQTVPNTDTQAPLIGCGQPLPPPADLACYQNGMRCETFARSEFGEVVEVFAQDGQTICSGTLVSQHWVLTAAHCFLPGQSAADFNGARGVSQTSDARVAGVDLGNSIVAAANSHLGIPNYFRQIDYALVDAQWDPAKRIASGALITTANGITEPSDWTWPGDLALIRLTDADAITTAQPAVLASSDYTGLVTTAGYGVTTVGDGSAGTLYVAWPDNPVSSANGALELDQPQGKNLSTFCKGDSGGPAFEGRDRGCPASTGEVRPRVLVGVASYYYGDNDPTAQAAVVAQACQAAPVMRFINVSSPSYRSWICNATGKEASGCT